MHTTNYGSVYVLENEAIFKQLLGFIIHLAQSHPQPLIGLSGGSTPKAFYQWVIEGSKLSSSLAQKCIWTTSDERMVSLDSPESNAGTAKRLLLDPLNVPEAHMHFWDTHLSCYEAARKQNILFEKHFARNHCLDLCILGMGEDAHIASLFPNSPLIDTSLSSFFGSVEVPGKGQRLTITPSGLKSSKHIVVLVCGQQKAKALQDVFYSDFNPKHRPAQILHYYAPHTTWLVDTQAAHTLDFK